MSPKQNTNPSFYSMLKSSFYELFHHKSDKKLIDYHELESLVDWHDLKDLVDWNELKLVDFNHFKVLNITEARFMLRYVGAFAVFAFMIGLVALSVVAIRVNSTYNSSKASDDTPSIVYDLEEGTIEIDSPVYEMYGEVSAPEPLEEESKGTESEDPLPNPFIQSEPVEEQKNDTPEQPLLDAMLEEQEKMESESNEKEPLMDENNDGFKGEETYLRNNPFKSANNTDRTNDYNSDADYNNEFSYVAYLSKNAGNAGSESVNKFGVGSVYAADIETTSNPVVLGASSSCSFNVDRNYYSSGSNYSLGAKKDVVVCPAYSDKAYTARWNLQSFSNQNLTSTDLGYQNDLSDCMTVQNVKPGDKINVSVFDSEYAYTDMCTLNIVK